MPTLAAAALLLALSQTPSVLTLDGALARAAEANLDLAAARARLDQAREELHKAWSAQLPQLGASASYTRNDQGASLGLPTGLLVRDLGAPQGPPAGGAVPGAPTTLAVVPSGTRELTVQRRHQLGAQAQATQALVAPRLWLAIDAARLGARAAERGLAAAREEILFGVAQVFYGAASLAEGVTVARELLETTRRQEEETRTRWRAGTIPRAALVRAELDRARAEQDLVQAENAHASAKLGLALLLDRPADFEVERPPEPALPVELGGLEDAALRTRPDLQAARLSEASADALRRAAALGYAPTVAAFARYQASNVRGFSGEPDAWAVGVGISWTLLDGGLRGAELRQARARVAEAGALRRGAEARARTEVSRALLDLGSARASAAKAREQRELAGENLRLVTASYRAGTATAVEQADATAALRTAETLVTAEALGVNLAALRVMKAAGLFEAVAGLGGGAHQVAPLATSVQAASPSSGGEK